MCPDDNNRFTRDPLTGVFLRALLDEQLAVELERAHRYERPLSLLFLDIDYFKSINDGFGHARGDQVLVRLASLLPTVIRSADLVYRYGGDEFVILLPETDQLHAAIAAQRILEAAQSTPFDGDPPLTISLSIGTASFPQDSDNAEMLITIADRRHYQAKRSGRNRVVSKEKSIKNLMFLDEPPRLLERDHSMDVFNHFLNALKTARQGVLAIDGPSGVGKTRFMKDACDIAQLQGFTILALQGKPGMHGRAYGALSEALFNWLDLPSTTEASDLPEQKFAGLPHPALGIDRFLDVLRQLQDTKERKGLIITLDHLDHIDSATFDFIQKLMESGNLTAPDSQPTPAHLLAVIYPRGDPGTTQSLFRGVTFQTFVELSPLTIAALRVWVRHSMQWEAPQTFLDWLFHETRGLPRFIQRALSYLVMYKHIVQGPDGWTYMADLLERPLPSDVFAPLTLPRHNLPENLVSFIGMERELYQLKQLLQKHTFVTITGTGGVGKSTLAVQAGLECLDDFRDGVFLLPMSDLNHADELTAAIAQAVQYSMPDKSQEHLINYLRVKKILLILDNFENLLDCAPLLTHILDNAQGVKLLVTSRLPLGLANETVLQLNGLVYPKSVTDPCPEAYSAVQLFMQISRSTHPDFNVVQDDFKKIIHICQLVGGSPLGIKLAAGWVRTLSLDSIVDMLVDNLELIRTKRTDITSRHRSLRAVLDSLWSMLSPSEQQTLAKLSVFQGGFNETASWQIAGASTFFLQALVAHAYLIRGAQGRYETHEMLRQYGIEKLRANPEEEAQVRKTFTAYFLKYLSSREPALFGQQPRNAALEIQQEWDNIHQAWCWAAKDGDVRALVACLDALVRFLTLRGLVQSNESLFQIASDAIQGRQDVESLELRAKLLSCQALSETDHTKNSHILTSAQEVVDLGRALHQSDVEAEGHLVTGIALLHQGDLVQSRKELEIALELSRTGDSRQEQSKKQSVYPLESTCLSYLGIAAMKQTKYTLARNYLGQSLDLIRQKGDVLFESELMLNLGELDLQENRVDSARDHFKNALGIFNQLDCQLGECNAHFYLGRAARLLSDYPTAETELSQALSVYQEFSIHAMTVETLLEMGLLHHHHGENDTAREFSGQAAELAHKLGDRLSEGKARTLLGDALLGSGKHAKAAAAYEAAVALFRSLDQPNLAQEPLEGLERVKRGEGSLSSART